MVVIVCFLTAQGLAWLVPVTDYLQIRFENRIDPVKSQLESRSIQCPVEVSCNSATYVSSSKMLARHVTPEHFVDLPCKYFFCRWHQCSHYLLPFACDFVSLTWSFDGVSA